MLESFREQMFTKAVEGMEKDYRESIAILKEARKQLDAVVDLLVKAECKIPETPDGDRIGSLEMDLENLGCDIGAQIERMEKE